MYSYSDLQKDMERLAKSAKVFSIGKSLLSREIYAAQFGEKPKVLIFGAIHAREWITAPLLVALAEKFGAELFGKSETVGGKTIEFTDIAFVPMVNPDGVELCAKGITSVSSFMRAKLTKINGGNDFSLWKANANAVDLNVNFDADWGTGAQNVFSPAPANYVGAYPFSENETRALANFALKSEVALAYHTKGEVVYYGFHNGNEDLSNAERFADELHYTPQKSVGSAGGFKDWFTLNELGLGLTVECGKDSLSHPLNEANLAALAAKHRNIARLAIEVANDV